MPRYPRKKSNNVIFHITQRGIGKNNIYKNDNDKIRSLEIISKYLNKYSFTIYAYCLMNNHYHILINNNDEDISHIMKCINTSYAQYFNLKYDRVGHLF